MPPSPPDGALQFRWPVVGAAGPKVGALLKSADVSLLSSYSQGAATCSALATTGLLGRASFEQLQDRMVRRQLGEMPLSALRDASKDQLRVKGLERGLSSVQDVLDHAGDLPSLAGSAIGRLAANTAHAIRRAARETSSSYRPRRDRLAAHRSGPACRGCSSSTTGWTPTVRPWRSW